jgi:hypothetical protein
MSAYERHRTDPFGRGRAAVAAPERVRLLRSGHVGRMGAPRTGVVIASRDRAASLLAVLQRLRALPERPPERARARAPGPP